MKLLNLGCGRRFHPAWTNIDFISADKTVITHDLRLGIPAGDKQFDVVYHSHVLEHFSRADGLKFLHECYRVLKDEGVIRIAVPDLEMATRLYIRALDAAIIGDEQWQHHYEWMKLAMYDQTVREKSGGDMADYLLQQDLPNRQFVLSYLGKEAENIMVGGVVQDSSTLINQNPKSLGRFFSQISLVLQNPKRIREMLLKRILGSEYELLQLGRFRRGGEIHLWMYDRYSLSDALQTVGFHSPHQVGPIESKIHDWKRFHLDTEPDGAVYKPDSLYMEATKT